MTPSKSDCTETRERLPLFAGGDLDPEGLASVREHLAVCRACAERAERAAQARRVLIESLRAREPDYRAPALWEGVRARLQAEGPLGSQRPSRSPSRSRVRVWGPALAAGLLVGVALFGFDRGERSAEPAGGAVEGLVQEVSPLERVPWDATPPRANLAGDTPPRRALRRVGPGEAGLVEEALDLAPFLRERHRGREPSAATSLANFQ